MILMDKGNKGLADLKGYYLIACKPGPDLVEKTYCDVRGMHLVIRTCDNGIKAFDKWHKKDGKFLCDTGIMCCMKQLEQ